MVAQRHCRKEMLAQHGFPSQPAHGGMHPWRGLSLGEKTGSCECTLRQGTHEVNVAMDSRNRSAAPARSRVAARNVASYTCPKTQTLIRQTRNTHEHGAPAVAHDA